MENVRHTLGKQERLKSKKDIESLLALKRFGSVPGGLRFCYRPGTGTGLNRIMVSVPKKNFKRAVKRNLLKRRIRESYRLQKQLLTCQEVDILFIYSSKEVMDYALIYDCVGQVLKKINSHVCR